MPFDLPVIRDQFPALKRSAIFFDNPGGTQISKHSLDRIENYLINCNANHGGAFATSLESDALLGEARQAVADFLNAGRPDEIIFGPNMTTLTFGISRALGRTFNPGDTLVVTCLDHDANISPWLMVAEDRGCKIRWVDFHPEDCTLDLDDLKAALAEKPRLVAVGYASNAVGTINPLAEIIPLAHQAGALVYVDAVQYAPHGPIDVQRLDCDFLVCSAYKFFGPHMGALYGRYDLLKELTAYRVRPAPALPPGKFETGTGNFEGMAGVLGALEYLQWLGEKYGEEQHDRYANLYQGRRLTFKQAASAIQACEIEISRALIKALRSVPGLKLYGITDEQRVAERVPTFSFTLPGFTPRQVAECLAEKGIYVWDGNFYALAVTDRLGLESQGGLIRVGATHYNSLEEVHRLEQALHGLVSR
ncbi:MAG: cysteine desulfurase-like protein [Anaerolineaceae bacterium]|nr:cysteine desulfurase-like protein [Anaerolineaceae bacterium]